MKTIQISKLAGQDKITETVIDRTNGGEGRMSNVRAYINGKLCRHIMIFTGGKTTYKFPAQ